MNSMPQFNTELLHYHLCVMVSLVKSKYQLNIIHAVGTKVSYVATKIIYKSKALLVLIATRF